MPRIRKQTSNRRSTNDRRKIQRKAKESRKKKAKEAKKNPQWKSKHKKDPGIPNDFPYKDQILAEVAEQRRIATEEKDKRKEEKRLARRQEAESEAQNPVNDDQNQENLLESKNLDVGSDAIASISAKLINPKFTTMEKKMVETVDDDDEEGTPILVNHDLPTLKAVLDGSDVLLEVLDARDPLAFRSLCLEKAMEGKKVLLVLNKIDTCPRESLSAWLTFFRREHPTFLFRSATAFLPVTLEPSIPVQAKGKAKAPKNDALGAEAILAQLSSWAEEKGGSPLNVAVAGLTNAGKSSFLNSLLRNASLPVYSLSTSSRGPTTTVLPQELILEADAKPIRFIDTPGLLWSTGNEGDSLEDLRARDILLRCKGRIDRLKDPSAAVSHIVSRASPEDLMVMYSLPAFTKGDSTAFLSGVARSNQLLKKRGELDLTGASKIVLRDWNTGKFARYTLPPVAGNTQFSPTVNRADDAILNHVRLRKEIRKNGGLVKLLASGTEKREVGLERPWEEEMGGDEEGDEVADDKMMNADGEGEEEESESEEEEVCQNLNEEMEIEPPLPKDVIQKRKRAASLVSLQPTKKVAFASHHQNEPTQPPTKRYQQEQEPKSILKKSVTVTKQKHLKPALPKEHKKADGKIANVSNSLTKASATADPSSYDFTKFF